MTDPNKFKENKQKKNEYVYLLMFYPSMKYRRSS